jgi:hypothetical protein
MLLLMSIFIPASLFQRSGACGHLFGAHSNSLANFFAFAAGYFNGVVTIGGGREIESWCENHLPVLILLTSEPCSALDTSMVSFSFRGLLMITVTFCGSLSQMVIDAFTFASVSCLCTRRTGDE